MMRVWLSLTLILSALTPQASTFNLALAPRIGSLGALGTGGLATPLCSQRAESPAASGLLGLEMRRHVQRDPEDAAAAAAEAEELRKFGKLKGVVRQKKGNVIGARGAVKVQGQKWENLVAKPPTIRVMSGTAKGRKLDRPDVYLRPMMGKVKEALFSIIRDFDVLRDDACALDTFAGCGTVGIEALSQGIGKAVFVDFSKEATRVIEKNLQTCGFEERGVAVCSRAEAIYDNPETVLKRFQKRGFDLLTITPPYEEVDYGALLSRVVKSKDLLADGAIVAIEYPTELGSLPPVLGNRLIGMRNRKYGRTMLAVYCLNPGVDHVPRPEEFGQLRTDYLVK